MTSPSHRIDMSEETTDEPTSMQCWGAERVLSERNVAVEPRQITTCTEIDLQAGDYGEGGWYSYPRAELWIRWTEGGIQVDLDRDFDLEWFVEDCIAAKSRWRTLQDNPPEPYTTPTGF